MKGITQKGMISVVPDLGPDALGTNLSRSGGDGDDAGVAVLTRSLVMSSFLSLSVRCLLACSRLLLLAPACSRLL